MVGCYNDRVNIQDIGVKIKTFLEDDRSFLTALLIAVAAASFGLGRLSISTQIGDRTPQGAALIQKAPLRTSSTIEASSTSPGTAASPDTATASGYVGSKNGTKYHLPWCSGAARILEENRVLFATKAEAEAAGYTPAANCPGI